MSERRKETSAGSSCGSPHLSMEDCKARSLTLWKPAGSAVSTQNVLSFPLKVPKNIFSQCWSFATLGSGAPSCLDVSEYHCVPFLPSSPSDPVLGILSSSMSVSNPKLHQSLSLGAVFSMRNRCGRRGFQKSCYLETHNAGTMATVLKLGHLARRAGALLYGWWNCVFLPVWEHLPMPFLT